MKSAPIGVTETLSLFFENPEESKSLNDEEKNLRRILHQLHRFAKDHQSLKKLLEIQKSNQIDYLQG
jgi:cell shape-determining protein MreC